MSLTVKFSDRAWVIGGASAFSTLVATPASALSTFEFIFNYDGTKLFGQKGNPSAPALPSDFYGSNGLQINVEATVTETAVAPSDALPGGIKIGNADFVFTGPAGGTHTDAYDLIFFSGQLYFLEQDYNVSLGYIDDSDWTGAEVTASDYFELTETGNNTIVSAYAVTPLNGNQQNQVFLNGYNGNLGYQEVDPDTGGGEMPDVPLPATGLLLPVALLAGCAVSRWRKGMRP